MRLIVEKKYFVFFNNIIKSFFWKIKLIIFLLVSSEWIFLFLLTLSFVLIFLNGNRLGLLGEFN